MNENNLRPAQEWLLRLALWSTAGFILILPFSHTVAARLLLLFLAVAAISLVAGMEKFSRSTQDLRWVPPLLIPFLFWGAWSLASVTWSDEPARSWKEFQNEVLYTLVVFWVCYVVSQLRGSLRILGWGLALSALGASLLAVAVLAGGEDFPAARFHTGAQGISSLVIMLLPFSLAMGWAAQRANLPRALVWLLYGVIPTALLCAANTTNQRMVWLGTGAVLLGFSMLLMPASRPSKGYSLRARATWAAIMLLTLAVAAFMSWQVFHNRFGQAGTGLTLVSEGDPHMKIWALSLEQIGLSPWLGHGFGRGIVREELFAELHFKTYWHSHNLVLETMLQAGIPGLMLLLALFGATAWEGRRMILKGDSLSVACGISLILLVAGTLIRNMTDVIWVRNIALLYWSLAGILLGWCAGHGHPGGSSKPYSQDA